MSLKNSNIDKPLPRKTMSLCPQCKKIIDATIYEVEGKVMIKNA